MFKFLFRLFICYLKGLFDNKYPLAQFNIKNKFNDI